MSAQIQREHNAYYDVLGRCQKGALDITEWMVLVKAGFWKTHAGESFNERQRKVINRWLDRFEGKLTSSKWAKLTKCSQDTALRDISDLVERHILAKEPAGGRSTSYTLSLPRP